MNRKCRVYLAGPISGCNDDQRRRWRDKFKSMFGREVGFEDPASWGDNWEPEREVGALEISDVVVANMWRESIGTTIGVIHARLRGIPVVLVDPNYLKNRIVQGWIAPETPVHSLDEARARVQAILATLEPVREVVKKNGTTAPFSRQKLVRSIRTACAAAGVEDPYLPTLLVNDVMRRLRPEPGSAAVRTEDVKEAIHRTLDEVGRSTIYRRTMKDEAAAVREAWKKREEYKTAEELFDEAVSRVKALEAEVESLRENQAAMAGAAPAVKPAPERSHAKWTCLSDAVQEADRQFRGELEFLPRALRSAEDSPFAQPARAFHALKALAACARDRRAARSAGRQVPGMRTWFARHRSQAPWLEYKAGESEATMNKWGDEREFTYDGSKVEMQQHLAIGAGKPESTLRIYFCPHPDPACAEFLIGHVGRHPRNTRK